MDTGIYVALSREVGLFQDLSVTANNIANINTTGYQADDLLFTDYLAPASHQEGHVQLTDDYTTFRNTEQGTLQMTEAPLDAAIEGRGYFAIQTPLGPRYTRNGNFKISPDGVLVTSDGYPVQDADNNVITFDPSDRVIQIKEDGTVNVDGSPRDVMKIVQFGNEQLLRHVGNNLFSADSPPQPADNFRVVAGALERSNVNAFQALTHLISVQRSVSDVSQFINTMYQLERNASNTLAKYYS